MLGRGSGRISHWAIIVLISIAAVDGYHQTELWSVDDNVSLWQVDLILDGSAWSNYLLSCTVVSTLTNVRKVTDMSSGTPARHFDEIGSLVSVVFDGKDN
jgi:hypothetical protein